LIKIEIKRDPRLKKVTVITGVTNKHHQKAIKNLLKEKKPNGHNCVICRKTGDIIVQGVKKVNETAEVVAKALSISINDIDFPR